MCKKYYIIPKLPQIVLLIPTDSLIEEK